MLSRASHITSVDSEQAVHWSGRRIGVPVVRLFRPSSRRPRNALACFENEVALFVEFQKLCRGFLVDRGDVVFELAATPSTPRDFGRALTLKTARIQWYFRTVLHSRRGLLNKYRRLKSGKYSRSAVQLLCVEIILIA